jgi:hypothetical protein
MGTDGGDPGAERYLDVWRALHATVAVLDGLRMSPPESVHAFSLQGVEATWLSTNNGWDHPAPVSTPRTISEYIRARPKKTAGVLWRNLHTHPNFATIGDAYDVTDLPTSEAPYRPFSSLAVLEFLRFVAANLLGDLTSNPSARKDGG